jgi:NADH:ubiquinone oxidoreductase subunit F (NADH-binding)
MFQMDYNKIHSAAAADSPHYSDPDYTRVFLSSQTDNIPAGLLYQLQEMINTLGLKAFVIPAGSTGYYSLEPLMIMEKPHKFSILFKNITSETVLHILKENAEDRVPRNSSLVCNFGPDKMPDIPDASDIPLFNLEKRIALRNCGFISPEEISHYILRDNGYYGLAKCLKMKPLDVINELQATGLRGRGGAGFITAVKWQKCYETGGDEKYVICNGIDADPKAITARLLLESDPHSILEGMLIGAYAVGANRCYLYINDDYPVAFKILQTALQQMNTYNLIGANILGSSFSCEIEIKTIPRSLVAGEETTILSHLMGKQPMPYLRLQYPSTRGYLNKPTLINNIETFSNISAIFHHEDSKWYTETGTESSKGSKIITLAGNDIQKHTVEVPFGTSIRQIIGGAGYITSAGKIKAVQFGGPTGVLLNNNALDITIDYEVLKNAGAILGSGTIEIFNDDTCAVELVRDLISWLHAQSCGKCVFCREGTYQMSQILKDITTHKGKLQDLELLVEIGEAMKTGSICGLGKTAPNPVLSSINSFPHDFDSHLNKGECPYRH